MAVSTTNNSGKNTNKMDKNTSNPDTAKTPLPKWMPKKPMSKQILAAPCSVQWPTLGKKAAVQVTNAFLNCLVASPDVSGIKPPWTELRKVERKLRKEAIEKYRAEALNKMPSEQRQALLEAMSKEKEQLSHMFLGYNQIMRELQKGEVAALLINKSSTPEMLPMSFLAACTAKSVPAVAIENLDKVWRKCIAVGFKRSVISKDNCFYPLYEKMVQVTEKAAKMNAVATENEDESDDAEGKSEETDDECKDDSSVQIPLLTKHDLLLLEEKKLPLSTVLGDETLGKGRKKRRRQGLPPPVIDVSKYILKRTRTDQRAFIPGVGMNKLATMEDLELITVATDVPGVGSESAFGGFDYRVTHKKGKGYQGKKPYLEQRSDSNVSTTLGENPLGETESSSVNRNISDDVDMESYSELNVPNLEKKSSEVMFQLDFEGDDCSSQTDTNSDETIATSVTDSNSLENVKNSLKRKRSILEKGVAYVPASVKRIVANRKRKMK